MPEWWEAAPLAQSPQAAPPQGGAPNWWESAPLAQQPKAQAPGGEDQTAWYERGFRGLRDVVEGSGQLGSRMAMPFVLNREKVNALPAKVDAEVKQSNADYDARRGANAGSFDGWRTAGNIAGTAPLAALAPVAATIPGAIGMGALVGSGTGAMQPVTGGDFWSEKGKQVGSGAAMGGVAGGLMSGLGRIISPKVSPEVAAMRDANVDLPPGRAMGGIAKSAEGALRDVPIGGGFVRAADTRALGQYNVASVNEALKPLGVTFDTRATAAGNDLIKQASAAVENAYGNAASKISGTLDDAFKTDVSIVPRLAEKLPQDMRAQVIETLKQELPLVEGVKLDGAKLIEIKKTFRDLAYEAKKAGAPDTLSEIYRTVSKSVDGLIERISPEGHKLAKAADEAYRNMMTVGKASTKALADGVFTPTQLAQASRTVGGQSATASGTAPMQPFAQAGMKALDGAGGSVPRGDILGLLGSPISGAIGLGTALPFHSPGAQQAWMTAITRRPSQAQAFADALRSLDPFVASGAANMGAPRSATPTQKRIDAYGRTI